MDGATERRRRVCHFCLRTVAGLEGAGQGSRGGALCIDWQDCTIIIITPHLFKIRGFIKAFNMDWWGEKTVFLKKCCPSLIRSRSGMLSLSEVLLHLFFFKKKLCVCVWDFVRLLILFSSFRVKPLKQEILYAHQLIKNKPEQIWNSTGIGLEHNENRFGIWSEPD